MANSTEPKKILLETRKLSKDFGGLHAISNLDLKLEQGEMRGLIGPNGSGKSTLATDSILYIRSRRPAGRLN